MSERTKRFRAGAIAVAILAAGSCTGRRAGPLERIGQVAELPFQVADRRVTVHLKGWVTLSDPITNLMFLEDRTGAARVALPSLHLDPRPGNLVDVIGEVTEGGPAPTIVASEVRLLEGSHEPRALPTRPADLVAGRTGFRYVAAEGVLRSSRQDRSGDVVLRIGSGATVFEAYIGSTDLPNLNGTIGARIRVRAVANPSRDVYGRVARVQVWIPRSTDFEVLMPAPQGIPAQTVREVAALPRNSLAERMLHLHGSVLADGGHEGLRFEDGSGSIGILQSSSAVLPIGGLVDVSGFAELDGGKLRITDARLLQTNPTRHYSDKDQTITSVAEVHALGPEDAGKRVPVHVLATVTYINPATAVFFVQDQTGATYVGAPRIREFKVRAGDLVDLTGVTSPGQFAPIISGAWAERVSSSSLPPPSLAAFDELLSGRMDSAWVQTEGIVQSLETQRGSTVEDAVWLQWGDHRYLALVHNPRAIPLPPPDSRVQVRGVCASLFNARRQIVGIQIYVPLPELVSVLEPGPDPVTLRAQPIDELLRFSFSDSPGHRTRVRGVVTLARPSGPSYVEDSGAGVKIVNHARMDLRPGDVVDVLGFGHSGSFSPEMRDAQISLVERGPAPSPPSITMDEALEGTYDSRLVTIDATVVDQLRGPSQNALMLQVGGKLFNATLDHGRIPPLDRGCIVRVTGVCSIAAENNLAFRIPKSFSLVLRGAGDIAVVRSAPWWNPGRLLAVLGSMAALLLAVLSWVAVLRRRVGLQTAVIGKKLEEEKLLKLAAEEASRAKSEFLANMSHEIRTPLNGILGFAGLMAESELTGLQREHNEAVRSSAENLLVVINDILDFSRVEAGRLELESLDFSIRRCVEDALGSVQALAAEKGLATSVQIDGDVPDWVLGDPHRLRQVLVNLLGNAVKFTAAGAIAVRVSLPPEPQTTAIGSADPPAPRIQFSVTDTGIGVPELQRELIFQPFRQADGSITRRFGGTGLGLAISRKLVALMGGGMWLQNTPGPGSAFFFTASLPPGQAPAGGEKSDASSSGHSPAEQSAHRTLSILVAEDNAVNQRLIRILLEKRGHRVTVVGNGAAALAAWLKGHFDCILMDIQMPEMDGYEATRRIRAREPENGPRIPIIALTAHAMKGDRDKCLRAGLDSYVSKPIQTAALDAALEDLAVCPDLSAASARPT